MTEQHRKRISDSLKNYAKTDKAKEHYYRAGHANAGKPKPGRQGDKHPLWKGDNVGYYALHNWVNKMLGKAETCQHCHTTKSKLYDWANISREYKRDLTDWMSLCRSCHQKYDDVKARSWVTRKAKYEKAA